MQGGLAADQRDHSAQDIGVIASGAAYSQGIAEQADWLGSAKITLQVRYVTFCQPDKSKYQTSSCQTYLSTMSHLIDAEQSCCRPQRVVHPLLL